MRTVQNRISRWKQVLSLLLCFVIMMSAGWTAVSAETAAPEIPEPPESDLLFFDRDGNGRADRVGIVSEVNRESGTVDVIVGGRSGRVDTYTYGSNTAEIMGYAALPANPDAPAAPADPEGTTQAPEGTSTPTAGTAPAGGPAQPAKSEDEEFVLVAGFAGHESGITIYIEAGKGSVPPDTMMTLSSINGNMIKSLVNDAADGEVLETRALHVLLHDQLGNTVDPQKPMRFRQYPSSWNYTADHLLVLQILEDSTVNIVARSEDFREIATSGIRFEAQDNGIYAIVNVA